MLASARFLAQRSQHFESARWGMDGDCLRGAAREKRAGERWRHRNRHRVMKLGGGGGGGGGQAVFGARQHPCLQRLHGTARLPQPTSCAPLSSKGKWVVMAALILQLKLGNFLQRTRSMRRVTVPLGRHIGTAPPHNEAPSHPAPAHACKPALLSLLLKNAALLKLRAGLRSCSCVLLLFF
jgi:hypothetical protein